MRQNMSCKERKALVGKMVKIFKADTKMLSKEMQTILMDDLVTAFLNRLNILTAVENSRYEHDLTIRCSDQALQLIRERPKQS